MYNASWEPSYKEGRPSAWAAARVGDIDALRRALDSQALDATDEDGRTPLALARAFQVPKTTMSHTLAVLERRGLVDLRPNPKDARSKLVWLTGAGRQFRDDAIAALAPDMAALAVQFDAADIAELTTKLQEVRVFLDRRRDEPD